MGKNPKNLFGVFAQDKIGLEKIILQKGFFWDQSWLETTPPTGFLDFSPVFQIFVFHICIYLGYWGVEGAMFKILVLYDKNPWRNN